MLVGRGGAAPHDLRRYADQGRVFWDAAPSQWYAEPKRLADAGLLKARKAPGRTGPKTLYEITDSGRAALEEWARTPAKLPRMQHESVVRLLAADLISPQAALEGISAMEQAVEAGRADLARARGGWQGLEHRVDLLSANDRFAVRLLDAQEQWLREAREVLERRAEAPPPGRSS